MRYGAALILAALLCAPAMGGAAATAKIVDLNGKRIGRADLTTAAHGVLIEIDVKNLAPGAHAILLHTTASCDPARKFTSAGPVFGFDAKRPHGYYAKGGPRAGDLPTQFAGADGTLHATMFTTAISLGNGKKSIFDRDGVSIIIHAEGDDYATQPDGRSGARVACGTIMRTVAPGPRKRTAKRT